MTTQRASTAMEFDALISIMRVLEPLSEEARERCLAAARCSYNAQAATQALVGLVDLPIVGRAQA